MAKDPKDKEQKNQGQNNVMSLSEYRKKNWKRQEELIASGEEPLFMDSNESDSIDQFFNDETRNTHYNGNNILSLKSGTSSKDKTTSKDKSNLLSLSKHREKKLKEQQKETVVQSSFKPKEKIGKLLNLEKYKDKKRWKKTLSFYGREAGQAVAMAFVFVFLFVFALQFNDPKKDTSRTLASKPSIETEKDYIEKLKQKPSDEIISSQ